MDKSYIHKFYDSKDNSYCINIRTKRDSYLAPWYNSNKYNPTKHELNARFEIVTEPYYEIIKTWGGYKKICFINVKSNITGEIYRVTFYEHCVIDTFKDYNRKYNRKNPRYVEGCEKYI